MSNLTTLQSNVSAGLKESIWQRNLEICILVLMIITGVVGNFLIVAAILIQKELRKKTGNFFILSLAVSDFLVTTVTLPSILLNKIEGRNVLGNSVGCTIIAVVTFVSAGSSLYNMFMIAVNRYIHICRNNLYQVIFTNGKTVAMILGMYLFIVVANVLPLIIGYGDVMYSVSDQSCGYNRNHIFFSVTAIVLGVFVPAVVTLICYVSIFMKIRATPMYHTMNGKHEAVKTLFLVFLLFLACWFPFCVTTIYGLFKDVHPIVTRFSSWLALANSCINSFVYGLRSKQFRTGYKNILCFFKKKKVSPATTSMHLSTIAASNIPSVITSCSNFNDEVTNV